LETRGQRGLQIVVLVAGLAGPSLGAGDHVARVVAGLRIAIVAITSKLADALAIPELTPEVDAAIRLPGVDTPAAEAEGFQPHVLKRDIAGEDHQVGPGQRRAVLLFDGPEQT